MSRRVSGRWPVSRLQPQVAIAAAPRDDIEAWQEAARRAEREGRWLDARLGYERVLAALHPEDDARAGLLRAVARTYLSEGRPLEARDSYTLARRVAQELGHPGDEAHAINGLAIVEQQTGQLDAAESLYEEARAFAAAAGDDRLVAMLEQNLGTIASIRGQLTVALERYQASLERYRRTGMLEHAGPVLNNLAMLYTDLADWPAAEAAYEQARSVYQELGDDPMLRRIDVNQAGLWLARGDLARARARCEQLLALPANTGAPWLGDVHKHQGVVCREAGDLARADAHLRRAATIAEETHDTLLAAETAREQAELYWRQARHADTLQALNRAHGLFWQLRAQRELVAIQRRNARLEERFLEIARRWGESIESKDMYTQGHCERVAEVACQLARRVGFDERTLFWFRIGALLHDVGKLIVPSSVLNKPGRLTEEEWSVMQQHPEAGVALLADIDFAWDVRPMVRNHHERWDGLGYPDRLAGEAIPLSARILCIADVYDALTTTRPYRDGFPHERAVQVMTEMCAAGHFDPVLFDTFLAWARDAATGAATSGGEFAPAQKAASAA